MMKWGRLGEILRKALAFGHLESKQQEEVSEIRRILPNLGEFDQFRRFITRKAGFCGQTDGQTDGNISALRAGVPITWPTRIF